MRRFFLGAVIVLTTACATGYRPLEAPSRPLNIYIQSVLLTAQGDDCNLRVTYRDGRSSDFKPAGDICKAGLVITDVERIAAQQAAQQPAPPAARPAPPAAAKPEAPPTPKPEGQ